MDLARRYDDAVGERKEETMTAQDNWRWCNKCQGLAFAGFPSQGACPAGGLHNHFLSGDYVLSLA